MGGQQQPLKRVREIIIHQSPAAESSNAAGLRQAFTLDSPVPKDRRPTRSETGLLAS